MTEGNRLFRVGYDELKAHFEARAAHHQQRAEEKQKELPKLVDSFEKLRKRTPADVGVSAVKPTHDNMMWPDGKSATYKQDEATVESIEKEIRNHLVKASRFRFFAEHINGNMVTFSVVELQEYELIPTLQY
jgi:hypothetical protein